MVDYAGKIKLGVIVLAVVAGLAILAAIIVPNIMPGAAQTETAAAADEAMYELVWNGSSNDHVVIDDFAAFMSSTKEPILIDFWAEWCGPCRSAAPTIEKLAQTYAGKVHVVKINTDYAGPIAQAFGVSGIPNFVVVKDSTVINSVTGYSDTLEQSLSEILDAA